MLASEARQPIAAAANYFLKAGPVDFKANATMGVEYNDNIGLSQTNRQSDLILRPMLQIDSEWRLTTLNTMRFDIGIGYAKYLRHGSLDTNSILLDPGSQISFDVFVGGILKLNFHDRFAILQNPIDEPSLSNTARFDRFQNAAGVTGLFDFNDLKLVVGYDHFTYRTIGSDFNFLDRSEEQFFASVSTRMSDALTVGLDGSGSLVNYRLNINNNGTTVSAGPFAETSLSSYTKVRLNGGWQAMNFDSGGTTGDMSNYNGWYASLTVAQRLNQYWTHSLTVGREARLGLEVNFSEYEYVRYLAQWQINPRLSANFDAFVEHDDESGGLAQNSERSSRWGGGAGLIWRLGNKLTTDLRYRYVNKNSDLPLRDYYQNSILVDVTYTF